MCRNIPTRNACSLVLTAADGALLVPIGVSDKYDEAMVGERSQQWPVGQMAIQYTEHTKEPSRQTGYIRRRQGQTNSTPLEQSELGTKGALELVN